MNKSLLYILIVVLLFSACAPITQSPVATIQSTPTPLLPLTDQIKQVVQVGTLNYDDDRKVLDRVPYTKEQYDASFKNTVVYQLVEKKGTVTILKTYIYVPVTLEGATAYMLYTTDENSTLIFVPCTNWPNSVKEDYPCTEFPSEKLRLIYQQAVVDNFSFFLVYIKLVRQNPPNVETLTNPIYVETAILRTTRFVQTNIP